MRTASNSQAPFEKISLLGIGVCACTKQELLEAILSLSKSTKIKTVYYLNAHCVNIALADAEYKKILDASDVVYAGGQAVVWASRFLSKQGLPERVNILDFFDAMAEKLKEESLSIYLLGGAKKTVSKTADALRQRGLKVAGFRDGYFADCQEEEVVASINASKPDILMVGMGVPKQEKWIARHLSVLDVKLCWGVGAAFDWLSRERKRAPCWMTEHGLEWLHRLIQQPGRLWKRYLIGNPVFIWRVLREKLKGCRVE